MIPHKSLEDRLNAVKNGKQIPKPPMPEKPIINNQAIQQPVQTILTVKQFLFNEGYKVFNVLSASILYGFGLKAIFSTEWNFLGTLGVGFLLNHSLTILLKLLRK